MQFVFNVAMWAQDQCGLGDARFKPFKISGSETV
jgi:hypothetical protein